MLMNTMTKNLHDLMTSTRHDPSLILVTRLEILTFCRWHIAAAENSAPEQYPTLRKRLVPEDDPTYDYLLRDEVEDVLLTMAAHGRSHLTLYAEISDGHPEQTLLSPEHLLKIFPSNRTAFAKFMPLVEWLSERGGVDVDDLSEFYGYTDMRLTWIPQVNMPAVLALEPFSTVEALRAGIPIEDLLA